MSTGTYTVERTATIAAEPDAIYDRLADFHEWMQWSPWEDLDPDQQRTFSGAESGTGAAYAWSGNRKAGNGQHEDHRHPAAEQRSTSTSTSRSRSSPATRSPSR